MFIDELNKCGFTPNNVIIWDKLTHSMGNLKQSLVVDMKVSFG